MNILFLGPEKEPQLVLLDFLSDDGNSITIHEEKLNRKNIVKCEYDFLICFGYRYIISKEILSYFHEKAINLHISYLPWNKGADPKGRYRHCTVTSTHNDYDVETYVRNNIPVNILV